MTTATPSRTAQRSRTRRAIVDAATALIAEGGDPSMSEIAERAEVSRRTIYLHFPTLDQLVLDATVGLVNVGVDAALERVGSTDPYVRLDALVTQTYRTMESSLPLGRRLIRLTVDAPPPAGDGTRRGYRRIRWLEWVLEPVRDTLAPQRYEDLVSGLALVIGWEAFIVLLDVRGLSAKRARDVTLRTATAVLDAHLFPR